MALSGRRLLLVEQDWHVIDELRMRFAEGGFECEVALDVRTAQAILGERRMDGVVVDAVAAPPSVSGVSRLVGRLKDACPGVKVVIFNGVADRATQRKMRRLGADGYLSKKSDLSAVERSVRRLLGQGPPVGEP